MLQLGLTIRMHESARMKIIVLLFGLTVRYCLVCRATEDWRFQGKFYWLCFYSKFPYKVWCHQYVYIYTYIVCVTYVSRTLHATYVFIFLLSLISTFSSFNFGEVLANILNLKLLLFGWHFHFWQLSKVSEY